MDLSRQLAEHVARTTYADLPASTVHATKRALLDGVGVILAASGLSSEARPFIAMAEGPPQATILGTGTRASAQAAAFANGALAHALDYEDAFDDAPTHPNASLIPAALAVAEAHGPVSGAEFIAAMATGCDLVCRIGLSLRASMEAGGWYPPPILGAFGATAAVGRLMRLDPRQLLDAFSLILCQVSGPGEIKHSADTVIRAVREAFPARAAVVAAELAQRGVRGFDRPFEGEGGFFRLYVNGHYDPQAILDGLGEYYWIDRLSFKPWPACRGTHGYIESVLALAREHGFGAQDVRAIRLEGGEIQQMLVEPEERKKAPSTAIDAKFSIPFTVALALVRGKVTLDDFDLDARQDSELLRAADKVSFRQMRGWGRERAAAAAVEIELDDDRIFRHEIETPLGHPEHPLSDQALIDKFVDCATRAANGMPAERARELAQLIFALERCEDVAKLVKGFM